MDRPGRNQEEENIQLKIYSDQNTHGMAATFIIIALVFAGLMFSDVSGIKTELGVIESVVLWGAPVISLAITLAMYVAFCRVLVMSKEGCKVSFWKIHRFYKWNELKVKRYENYKGMRYGTPRGLKQGYEEGIFFSLKKDKKPKWMPPKTYCCWRRPWSAFFVNFYPDGIDADLGELQSEKGCIDWIMYLEKTKKNPTMKQIWSEVQRESENYPVDKELFFHYMDLWGVEIEGHHKEEG